MADHLDSNIFTSSYSERRQYLVQSLALTMSLSVHTTYTVFVTEEVKTDMQQNNTDKSHMPHTHCAYIDARQINHGTYIHACMAHTMGDFTKREE